MERKIFSDPCLVKFLFDLGDYSDHLKGLTVSSNYLPSTALQMEESVSMSSIVCEVTKHSLLSHYFG